MELFARCMYYSIHPIMVGWVTIYYHLVWTGHSLCAGSPEPLAKNEMGSHLFYAQENNTNRQNFMTMAKKGVRSVKFYNPGTEHCPGKNCKPVAHVGWNRGPHHRKFIQTSGSYVDGNNKEKYSETLLFWGEWEPDSMLLACYKNEPARYLYEPLFLIPSCSPKPVMTVRKSK